MPGRTAINVPQARASEPIRYVCVGAQSKESGVVCDFVPSLKQHSHSSPVTGWCQTERIYLCEYTGVHAYEHPCVVYQSFQWFDVGQRLFSSCSLLNMFNCSSPQFRSCLSPILTTDIKRGVRHRLHSHEGKQYPARTQQEIAQHACQRMRRTNKHSTTLESESEDSEHCEAHITLTLNHVQITSC